MDLFTQGRLWCSETAAAAFGRAISCRCVFHSTVDSRNRPFFERKKRPHPISPSPQANFVEIYNDEVRDLLNRKKEKIDVRHDNAGKTIVTNLKVWFMDITHLVFFKNPFCVFESLLTTVFIDAVYWLSLLLTRRPHPTRPPLQVVDVDSPAKVYALLRQANANRSVAKTDSNDRSSRSHR